MQKLIIKGSRELSGKISISGSKNASLPILAASILSNQAIIKNVPMVKDIFTMVELLNFIGLKTKNIKKNNVIEIKNNEKKIAIDKFILVIIFILSLLVKNFNN